MFKGAFTAFDIMGAPLEIRKSSNIEASWHNVGVFYKRAMEHNAVQKGLNRRFQKEGELEVY